MTEFASLLSASPALSTLDTLTDASKNISSLIQPALQENNSDISMPTNSDISIPINKDVSLTTATDASLPTADAAASKVHPSSLFQPALKQITEKENKAVSPSSPFSKFLKVPSAKKETRKEGQKRIILPKAVTGSEFRRILQEKKQQKDDAEAKKIKRQQEREMKKKQKQEEKEKKQKEKKKKAQEKKKRECAKMRSQT